MFNWIKRNLNNPQKDVSEPVLSFIKLVREHPENFIIGRSAHCGWYVLRDKKNKQTYKFCALDGYIGVQGINFLSKEESYLLYDLFIEMGERHAESERIKQRQKYIDIYCKG